MEKQEFIFIVVKELNGVKHMSKNQVNDFIDYIFSYFQIEENEKNKNTITEGINIYFKLN